MLIAKVLKLLLEYVDDLLFLFRGRGQVGAHFLLKVMLGRRKESVNVIFFDNPACFN